jgi:hypothetical protein
MANDNHESSRKAIIARMAATRAELKASNHVVLVKSKITTPPSMAARAQAGPLFLQSPFAEILAGSMVLSVIFGPSFLVRLAVGQVLTPWVTNSVRNLLSR